MTQLSDKAIQIASSFVGNAAEGDWKASFHEVLSQPIEVQAEIFLIRFVLSLQKGPDRKDAKSIVRHVQDICEAFKRYCPGKDKSLNYGGIEFGDIYNQFAPEGEAALSFTKRKEVFGGYDLDQNNKIDISEFLLFQYKNDIIKGWKDRNSKDPEQSETALIQELVSIPLYVDTAVDEAIKQLKHLRENYESEVKNAKNAAATGGEVKKRQLVNDLNKLENKYEDDKKGVISPDAIEKKTKKMFKDQQEVVLDQMLVIKQEDEKARGPQSRV